jgi:hypothetical protein
LHHFIEEIDLREAVKEITNMVTKTRKESVDDLKKAKEQVRKRKYVVIPP